VQRGYAVTAGRRARARCSSAGSSGCAGSRRIVAAADPTSTRNLFGEGAYAGKGIDEIDSFEKTQSRPEDVAETRRCSVTTDSRHIRPRRPGSDVEVGSRIPGQDTDVARSDQHRWAREDWQLRPWIFGRGTITDTPLAIWAGKTGAIPRRSAAGRCSKKLRRTCGAGRHILAIVGADRTMPLARRQRLELIVIPPIVLPDPLPAVAAVIRGGSAVTTRVL